MTSNTFRDRGRQLLANGYLILPIEPGAKRPKRDLVGWQDMRLGVDDLSRYPQCGVGVLTGVGANPIVAIDIDAMDAALSERFVAWCQENLGQSLSRVGLAPKTLLVYRASEAGLPKAVSAKFEDLFGNKHQLEVLGHGQQFVAYHIHPDTGRPYQWVDHLGGLVAVRADQLSTVTPDQIIEAISVFERFALEAELTKVASSAPPPKPPAEREPRSDEDFFGRVNDAAMRDLESWVPTLFPTARPYKDGYRVAQLDLGRELQEDISILQSGIKDFGVADMGDTRYGGRTPIDLTLEWAHLTMGSLSILTPYEAAIWLCAQMGTPREELGYGLRSRKEKEAKKDAARSTLAGLKAQLDAAQDSVALHTDVIPEIGKAIASFPVIESELRALTLAKAKALGTPLDKTEFNRLTKAQHLPTVHQAYPLTEFGNMDRMISQYGSGLMFVPETQTWYIWNGTQWRQAIGGEVEHFAIATVRAMPAAHGDVPEDKLGEFYEWCKISQQARIVANMVKLASTNPTVVVPVGELDKNWHFVGAKNGVIDLRSGALLKPDPQHRITLSVGCDYIPGAKCPLFEQTLLDVFKGNAEMAEFFMLCLGYALLGNPTEDMLFIPFGNGSNGKSTILGTIRKVFGDYAKSADASSFVTDGKSGNAGGAREDLVRLRGARFVYVNEPDEGGELREGIVKSMTGGDAIPARALYAKSSVELMPTWAVFMPTNHKPIIKGTDNGIWRRLTLIPFERNFENDPLVVKDPKREEKLLYEMPGILNRCVQAAIRYQREGLVLTNDVRKAREEYRSQMDLLAEWMDECCETDETYSEEMAKLWESWEAFAKRRGLTQYVRSSVALGKRLDSRFPSFRATGGVRHRRGLRLKDVFRI